MAKSRQKPNILVTGTPGVGKSSHCEALAKAVSFKIINVNQVVVDNVCHDGWNKEYESFMINEDKVIPFPPKMYEVPSLLRDFVAIGCTGGQDSRRRIYHRLTHV